MTISIGKFEGCQLSDLDYTELVWLAYRGSLPIEERTEARRELLHRRRAYQAQRHRERMEWLRRRGMA